MTLRDDGVGRRPHAIMPRVADATWMICLGFGMDHPKPL
jgi:hypothetical protein